jgi:hypothetical protein
MFHRGDSTVRCCYSRHSGQRRYLSYNWGQCARSSGCTKHTVTDAFLWHVRLFRTVCFQSKKIFLHAMTTIMSSTIVKNFLYHGTIGCTGILIHIIKTCFSTTNIFCKDILRTNFAIVWMNISSYVLSVHFTSYFVTYNTF